MIYNLVTLNINVSSKLNITYLTTYNNYNGKLLA